MGVVSIVFRGQPATALVLITEIQRVVSPPIDSSTLFTPYNTWPIEYNALSLYLYLSGSQINLYHKAKHQITPHEHTTHVTQYLNTN